MGEGEFEKAGGERSSGEREVCGRNGRGWKLLRVDSHEGLSSRGFCKDLIAHEQTWMNVFPRRIGKTWGNSVSSVVYCLHY